VTNNDRIIFLAALMSMPDDFRIFISRWIDRVAERNLAEMDYDSKYLPDKRRQARRKAQSEVAQIIWLDVDMVKERLKELE